MLFFLFFISSTYAVPPFLSEPQTGGILQIEHPAYNYYKYNEDIKLHFHIHNSTGYLLTNKTVSCLFHLYNRTQSHILEQNLNFDSNLIDFDITLNKNLFNLGQTYQYLVYCNNSDGGIYSNTFTITQDGNELLINENIIAILSYGLLTIIALIFLIMLHVFKEDNTSIVYGFLSGVFFLFQFVLLIAGFKLIPNIILFIDINYYIMVIYLLLALYCFIISYFFYKENYKPKEIDPYQIRIN